MSNHYYCCFIGAALALNGMSILTEEIPKKLDKLDSSSGFFCISFWVSRLIWVNIFFCVVLLFDCEFFYSIINRWVLWLFSLPYLLILIKLLFIYWHYYKYQQESDKKFSKTLFFKRAWCGIELTELVNGANARITFNRQISHSSQRCITKVPMANIEELSCPNETPFSNRLKHCNVEIKVWHFEE